MCMCMYIYIVNVPATIECRISPGCHLNAGESKPNCQRFDCNSFSRPRVICSPNSTPANCNRTGRTNGNGALGNLAHTFMQMIVTAICTTESVCVCVLLSNVRFHFRCLIGFSIIHYYWRQFSSNSQHNNNNNAIKTHTTHTMCCCCCCFLLYRCGVPMHICLLPHLSAQYCQQLH